LSLLLASCAAPPPLPFDLVDQKAGIHHGTFQVQDQHMDAMIGGKHFEGFYLIETGTAVVTTNSLFARRPRTFQSITTVSSNAARAVLTSADGERITCEFLLEGQQAIGDCRSSTGRTFQLMATGH
jgi:hypothetical protein